MGDRWPARAGCPGRVARSGSGTLEGRERRVIRGHADTILALAWRPGFDQFATSSLDKLVTIWDVGTGQAVRSIKNHADIVNSVAFSPDGKRLASGSSDRTAKVHDAEPGCKSPRSPATRTR